MSHDFADSFYLLMNMRIWYLVRSYTVSCSSTYIEGLKQDYSNLILQKRIKTGVFVKFDVSKILKLASKLTTKIIFYHLLKNHF